MSPSGSLILSPSFGRATFILSPPARIRFVLANDGKGTALEITPAGTVLVPGEGLPDENDLDAITEDARSSVRPERIRSQICCHTYQHQHPKEHRGDPRVGQTRGWRGFVCNRGGGAFVEVWAQHLDAGGHDARADRCYIEITDPKFMEAAFADTLQQIIRQPIASCRTS